MPHCPVTYACAHTIRVIICACMCVFVWLAFFSHKECDIDFSESAHCWEICNLFISSEKTSDEKSL